MTSEVAVGTGSSCPGAAVPPQAASNASNENASIAIENNFFTGPPFGAPLLACRIHLRRGGPRKSSFGPSQFIEAVDCHHPPEGGYYLLNPGHQILVLDHHQGDGIHQLGRSARCNIDHPLTHFQARNRTRPTSYVRDTLNRGLPDSKSHCPATGVSCGITTNRLDLAACE